MVPTCWSLTVLALSGGLNLFTEQRLRYFHVFIPSLQCKYDLQAGNTAQSKVESSWTKTAADMVGNFFSHST